MAEWFSCKGACEGSDPTSDTVKVDVKLLANEKENVQPLQDANKAKEAEEKRRAQEEERLRQQREQEQRRQAEEQAKRKREEAEAARRREEKVAAERAAAEAAAAAAEAAARDKARQEEALRIEAEQAKAQQEREAAERAAEAKRREEERTAAQDKVNAWCKTNGFSDMHTKKKSMMPLSAAKIPLHEAVKQKNQEIVGFLIQLGVDKEVKNSKGKTAAEFARSLDKGGSMANILALLE